MESDSSRIFISAIGLGIHYLKSISCKHSNKSVTIEGSFPFKVKSGRSQNLGLLSERPSDSWRITV